MQSLFGNIYIKPNSKLIFERLKKFVAIQANVQLLDVHEGSEETTDNKTLENDTNQDQAFFKMKFVLCGPNPPIQLQIL